MKTKICTKCLTKKPFSAFSRKRSTKDGYRSHCRECVAEYNRERALVLLGNHEDHEVNTSAGKRCYDCGDIKPASEFYKDRNSPDGLRSHCKPCSRWGKVRSRYGLLRDGWVAMWEAQGGRCAICQVPMERCGPAQDSLRAVVDHHPGRSGPGCHRALLHNSCNRALPEEPETLRRMAVYVEAGVEELLPDTPNHDTLDDLFGHLSEEQSGKRWSGVLTHYKVEPEEWMIMWNRQAGLCPCCREPMEASSEKHNKKTAHVDHCHTGGNVRALLGSGCNMSLGVFQDDPAIFRRAARYLELGAEGPVDITRLDADNHAGG